MYLQCKQVEQDFNKQGQACIWIPEYNQTLKFNANCTDLKALSCPSWEEYLPVRSCQMKMYRPLINVFTVTLSPAATILRTIRQLYTNVELQTLTQFTIHILGATETFELMGIDKYEEILHVVPHLSQLEIVYIGPDIPADAPVGKEKLETCDECNHLTTACPSIPILHSFTMVQEVYDVYAKSPDFKAPDLCVAFNAGLHLNAQASKNDLWNDTLQMLFTDEKFQQVPFLVTAYSREEAMMDAARLEKHSAKFLQQPALNPFRVLKPFLEPTGLPGSPFYYQNGYVMLVAQQQSTFPAAPSSAPSTPDTTWTEQVEQLPYIQLVKQSQQ
jgi:hypothetical protein